MAEMRWHAIPAGEALAALGTEGAGLSATEVSARRARYGANELPEPRRRSSVAVFVHQFQSPLIYLLLVAAALALALGERGDAIVIAIVVVLNAAIGAFQEGRAEHALAALRQLASRKASVVRDGYDQVIDARELVPGDILIVGAGDAVTADARLIEAAALQASEASLTGESVPIAKQITAVGESAVLADRSSMLYAGTLVTAGRARAVVVATGTTTEIGHIASLAETTRSQATPLERRVQHFGRILIVAALVSFSVFIAIGTLRGHALGDVLMIGISQMVGLVPEGLPVAMTIALAVGVQRMARRGAIVRRLAAVETLGSTTVICSDKTGTLTRNEMTATAVWLPDGTELATSGTGYAPIGELPAHPELARLLEAAVLCNDAHLVAPDDTDSRWRAVGDPTEAALVTLAIKGGLDPERIRGDSPRTAELPFDATAKLMATEHAGRIAIKGAPEAVLALCGIEPVATRLAVERMGTRALRVLAFAEAEGPLDTRSGFASLRGRAKLLGLVGEIDPPRAEAVAAVRTCREAGIRPVMVTGDHVATGLAVARELGIARDVDVAVDGSELERMSDQDLEARIATVAVFARVQPAQKLRIVAAYQRRGEVVTMTGDGVNDAPALVRADVGVAMGITGTDVAKEAAKVIITDDNFGTIVAAVEEGRVVNRNLKKAVLLLLATSIAEVLVLLGAIVAGLPPPFAAVQILWNNLVTEGVITVNLIMDPPEGDEMQRPPVRPDEPLVTRAMLRRLAVMTPTIVAVTLGWFAYRTATGVPHAVVQSESFTLLAVCEWFNVLNCLSEERSALSLRVLRNPWLVGGLVVGNGLQVLVIFVPVFNEIFHTVPFGLDQVIAIGLAGSTVLWVEELRKLRVRRKSRRVAQGLREAGDSGLALPLHQHRA